jgi:hypothetical protein
MSRLLAGGGPRLVRPGGPTRLPTLLVPPVLYGFLGAGAARASPPSRDRGAA